MWIIDKMRKNDKQGIALVIVLGMLAILVILSVSFATAMRTERLTSAAYLNEVRTRLMLNVGINRLMMQLDKDMRAQNLIYPPQFLVSADDDPATRNFNTNVLWSSTAEKYFQTSLRQVAENNGLDAAKACEWINIRNPKAGAGSEIIGRVSFIALNSSGLLDANFAGGKTKNGSPDPAMLAMTYSLFNEFRDGTVSRASGDISAPIAFTLDRESTWKRFDSVADIYFLGAEELSPKRNNALMNITATGYQDYIPHLTAYSYAPNGFLDTSTGTQFSRERIKLDLQTVEDNASEIKDRFTEMFNRQGIVGGNADDLYLSLIDYLDSEDEAGVESTESFCTEATPLINEIDFKCTFSSFVGTDGSTKYMLSIKPEVELFFPFGGANNKNTYTLKMAVKMDGMPAGYSTKISLRPAPVSRDPWKQGEYVRITNSATVVEHTSDPGDGAFSGATATIVAQLKENSNATVDALKNITIKFSEWDSGTQAVVGAEVNDPRFNHRQSEWKLFAKNKSTMKAVNSNVTFSAVGNDGTDVMYIRNGDMLSAGELGHLLYSTNSWRTIRLFHQPGGGIKALPVFDYFSTDEGDTRFGMVNPNSKIENVLASAFYGMSLRLYPGEDLGTGNAFKLDTARSQKIANQIITKGPYTNVSDLAWLNENDILSDIQFSADSRPQSPQLAEAVLRICAPLLDPRQNFMTAIVVAQAVNESDDNISSVAPEEVIGEQMGVAVIYRDPYPDSTGRNPGFVRFFRYVDIWDMDNTVEYQ